MKPNRACRIDGSLAKEANQVVLFRRGPSRYVQQLVWDLNTDIVTPGQWLKSRVCSGRSDVTSDGRYLLYTTFGGRPLHATGHLSTGEEGSSYTAISRPPYFTALAVWYSWTTMARGGFWENNRRLLLDHYLSDTDEAVPLPAEIDVACLDWTRPETKSIYDNRFKLRGWITLRDESLKERTGGFPLDEESVALSSIAPSALKKACEQFPRGGDELRTVMAKRLEGGFLLRDHPWQEETWSAFDDQGKLLRTWKPEVPFAPIWVDVDASGRMIFAERGLLYRWPRFPHGKPRVIADLRENKFENVEPPEWALSW